MDDLVCKLADEQSRRDQLAFVRTHFCKLADERSSWRVMYALAEVLLLLPLATICSCDDFDEIAAWGESHLAVPRSSPTPYSEIDSRTDTLASRECRDQGNPPTS
ncbi:MAG: transposase family protein [Beijerinckiaceae bacterium]